jgi:hypothetical protein
MTKAHSPSDAVTIKSLACTIVRSSFFDGLVSSSPGDPDTVRPASIGILAYEVWRGRPRFVGDAEAAT